jgi:hypothetical protein
MLNIRIVLEEELDLPRRLVDLWRTERGDVCDEIDYCEHGFNGHGWRWMQAGSRPGWVYDWDQNNHNRSWGYVFDFDDDTRGISRVNEVNPALRALGCRVDLLLEPAAPAPRVVDDFQALLADAIRTTAARWQTRFPPTDWSTSRRPSPGSTLASGAAASPWTEYAFDSNAIRWTNLDEYGNPLEDERF